MNIKIKFFGQHKEELNKSELNIVVDNNSNISDLVKILIKNEPKFSKFKSYAVAVNLNYENFEYILKNGDEVAIIPPVSGG
mgnify:CR=1 FL=1|jgi:molybdopterin converting factor subunit 1|tara:strand:+ start:1272 stop:1514 length:243 start_codon:yes stop_codon:yes gene_type:complete